MNLLHIIFNLINPDHKVTWLSQRYHRWEHARHDKRNREYIKLDTNEPSIYFDVPGGGKIRMSENGHSVCGKAVGFSFGVEWGRYGYCGGVLGRDEAKRMAEFIIQKCSEIQEPMIEEYKRRFPTSENYS